MTLILYQHKTKKEQKKAMRKILAVDDNLINLELLAHIIRKYYPDFQFISALSGEEGIQKATKELPDLVLLDIMMPGLDGYETCRILKENVKTKQIPIIMVSALGHDSTERSKGLNAGADSFLSKPYDQSELSAQINVALRIKDYQERLRKLNSELTLVEERERRRIAENLHDSLGQTLSLAFMNLSSIDLENCSPQVKKTVEFTSELLNKAIKESRELTYDLSPPILYELGFIPAVRWKLDQFEKNHQIKTVFNVKNYQNGQTKENEIFLYRTIGELLTNINKHAKASKVEVSVETNNHADIIVVEDNGIGINPEKIKTPSSGGGFGLLSISERIDSINGSFKIHSTTKGTRAEIILPISR
ncbi:response regulator [Maribellus sp. YY47]|uniref:ATP-binding response regulator n=1 Tax=Maribellus sp. YY47 TaxID=2929486 RepID=UPI00200073D5|nr:response regulator [Maribellus sp. YY47]MCK3684548.1 response regulator [Maribellus sp. YY47]